MRAKTLIASIVISISSIGTARAQTGGDLDLDSFRPAIDSRGYVTVNASQVLGHLDISLGLITDWAYKSLTLEGGAFTGTGYESGNSRYEVTNIISPTLQAAIGFGGFFQIGVSAPFRVVSGTVDPDFIGDANDPRDNDSFNFSAQGIGDIGFHAKVRLLDTSRFPIGFAVVGSVYVPAGYDKLKWLGEGKVTPRGSIVIDTETGILRLAANVGILLRSEKHSFTDGGDGAATPAVPGTGGTVAVKGEIPFGAGAALALSRDRLDLIAEVIGSVPLEGTNYQPLEALGALKVYLARKSFFVLGGGVGLAGKKAGNPDVRAFIGIVFEPNIGDRDGDGIKDDVDKCPDDPEDRDDFQDEDGCPEPDNDQDGILDVDDTCPMDPEDKDGFQDIDGCPDLDNDNDRIPDKADKCPNEPETYNGNQDDDGCPDKGRVIVHQSNIEILDKIYFETGKSIIKPESFPILDAIAATMAGNPDIQLVEIQGHADERGNDDFNLKLTDDRAHSVLKYLTDKGIDAARLKANGYGETKPIDPAHNERAWSKNRRVEFVIERRAGGG